MLTGKPANKNTNTHTQTHEDIHLHVYIHAQTNMHACQHINVHEKCACKTYKYSLTLKTHMHTEGGERVGEGVTNHNIV